MWRRFLPRRRSAQPQASGDIFSTARAMADATGARDFKALDQEIDKLKKNMDKSDSTSWLALLLLQSPRASHAQVMMDEQPHGYHDRKKRLYELIDFNDTFVSLVLQLKFEQLEGFTERLKATIDDFCASVQSISFKYEQYEAITHGLSREIAVYLTAQRIGLNAVMSSRAADAFGIDMQIQDPESHLYVNIDCKTGSSFFFRIKDLFHDGRINSQQKADAERRGWCEITNRNEQHHKTRIVLLRVDQDELGEIRDFGFVDDRVMRVRLTEIIDECGLNDGKYGHPL